MALAVYYLGEGGVGLNFNFFIINNFLPSGQMLLIFCE